MAWKNHVARTAAALLVIGWCGPANGQQIPGTPEITFPIPDLGQLTPNPGLSIPDLGSPPPHVVQTPNLDPRTPDLGTNTPDLDPGAPNLGPRVPNIGLPTGLGRAAPDFGGVIGGLRGIVDQMADAAADSIESVLGVPATLGVGQDATVVVGRLEGVQNAGGETLESGAGALGDVRASADRLESVRAERMRDLVRQHPQRLEMTDLGPAVRSEVIAIDPDPATLAAAQAAGFVAIRTETIEGLDIRSVTLRVPRGWSVDRALSRLQQSANRGTFAANHLHFTSGASALAGGATLAQGRRPAPMVIGMIDGGVAAHPALRGRIEQRGFAAGGPRPSGHGTAVASLIAGEGEIRGAAPGAALLVADVFGNDPAGGNALSVTRALGWMAQNRIAVVAISLVGPPNPLVARAVAQAQVRGVHIVAAVGNDGPAAPLAYPASYPGVIAVTGVDRRNRVLIEAGRALGLDYAAPGADMAAAAVNGRRVGVRGTSFAVPFVAGRLAHHVGRARPIAALDAEAVGAGRRGVARGIICETCRTPLRD